MAVPKGPFGSMDKWKCSYTSRWRGPVPVRVALLLVLVSQPSRGWSVTLDSINPFTAMSLGKLAKKVPNFKSLRLLPPSREYVKGFTFRCTILKVGLL